MKKLFKRVLIWFLAILSLTILLFGALFLLFSEEVEQFVKGKIDSSITGEFSYSSSRLTLFSTFPHISLQLNDFAIYNAPNSIGDTLLRGDQLSVGLNPFLTLIGKYEIDKIELERPIVHLKIDSEGNSNFDLSPSEEMATEGQPLSIDEQSLRDERGTFMGNIAINTIRVKDGTISFRDENSLLEASMVGMNYSGGGKLRRGVVRLNSRVAVDQLSLIFDNIRYIDKKRVKGRFVTEADTENLVFKFLRNRLSVAGMKSFFRGELALGSDGYTMELDFKSRKGTLEGLLSLIPEEFNEWYANTTLKGGADITFTVKGSTIGNKNFEPDIEAQMEIRDGFVKHSSSDIALEKVDGQLSVSLPKLDMDQLVLRLNHFSFNSTNGAIAGAIKGVVKGVDKPNIEIVGSGGGDLSALSDAIGLESYRVEGEMKFNLDGKGEIDFERGTLPVGKATVHIDDGSLRTPYIDESLSSLTLSLLAESDGGNLNSLDLNIDTLGFLFMGSPFTATAQLSNFDSLQYNIAADGRVNLDSLALLLGIVESSIKGEVDADLAIANGVGEGSLSLSNFLYFDRDWPLPFEIDNSTITFNEERAELKATTLKYGDSKLFLSGYLTNFVDYFLTSGTVVGALTLNSDRVDLQQFSQLFEDADSIDEEGVESSFLGVIDIPKRVNFSLNSRIGSLEFGNLKAKNFRGRATIGGGALKLDDVGVELAGGNFRLDAIYQPFNLDSAKVELKAKADSFDVKRAYNEVPMVKELMNSAANMEGLISLDYSISSLLDREMKPINHSIVGGGVVRLEDVKVMGLKVLGAISQATKRGSLNNPNLKGVTIKSSIANNIISFERTRMRIFGFRPRFEGEASIDGRLNIRFRLGLPPFGIIGIPITVTGTMDDPIVKFRRGRKGEILYDREESSETEETTETTETTVEETSETTEREILNLDIL